MKLINMKKTKYQILMGSIIFLLIFQSPFERAISLFSYIDELVGFLGILFVFIYIGSANALLTRNNIVILFAISAFLLTGLAGNLIYHYQLMALVLKDIYTNIKFFLSILAGYFCIKKMTEDQVRQMMVSISRFGSLILFLFFILDRITNLYGGQIRYGIRSAKLFYSHATYLAGCLVFLLASLMLFNQRLNGFYIVMDLIMLVMTLRSKAIVGAIIFVIIYIFLVRWGKTINIWQIMVLGVGTIGLAKNSIYYYYIRLAGSSARSVMMQTSFKILKDYFPIGTGFGTYASHSAAENYSLVYTKYGFENIWELSSKNPSAFLDDTFWPIIIGQNGFIGTMAYLIILIYIIKKCLSLKKRNKYYYATAVFIILYLLISSSAEPTFNNSIAIPLAFCLGIIFDLAKRGADNG